MSNLNYRTRGESTPNKKPKVYFCCHPEDFSAYFESVSGEILQIHNCAVWYYDQSPAEEWEQELSQMQLFVMPVTTRLLCTPNRAIDVEFSFAQAHHIPILPLMQEPGLEQLFNAKCGELQFLDKHLVDPTAISYEDKLKNYLDSVLIGDELAAKIRAAFEGYIFLSYRKMDRKYAQELMRLIHKNDFCRDIAIWYDEYLVPGENFNESIKAALEKCDLFALAVTPNLLIKGNYVLEHEYPEALKNQKPILPVEMVPTDPMQFKDAFGDSPNCTQGHNENELSAALLENMRCIALREDEDDPQHNFFIGLAYLSGIDVEVDRVRAVELITSAADAGLLEAISKLVEMYENGHGVEQNDNTAIKWMERKISILQKNYEGTPSEDNLTQLLCAFLDCGDKYVHICNYQKATEKFQRALEQVKASAYNNLLDWFGYRYLSMCQMRLGQVCRLVGDLAGAEEYYLEVLRIRNEIAERTNIVTAWHDLLVCSNKCGDLYRAGGKLEKALIFYKKSLEISEILAQQDDAIIRMWDVARSHENLGNLYRTQRNLAAAKKHYSECLRIVSELEQEEMSIDASLSVSSMYGYLGRIYTAEGDYEKAWEYGEKSLEIALREAEKTKNAGIMKHIAIQYNELGEICYKKNDLDGAYVQFRKGLDLLIELAETYGSVDIKRELAVNYCRMGNVSIDTYQFFRAEGMYREALDISQELMRETTLMEPVRDAAMAYAGLGKVRECRDQLDDAKEFHEKSLELFQKVLKLHKTEEAGLDVAGQTARLCQICEQLHDYPTAEKHLKTTIALRSGPSQDQQLYKKEDRIIDYGNLGDYYYRQDNMEDAKRCYEQVLSLTEDPADTDFDIRPMQAMVYSRLCVLLCGQGAFEDAKYYGAEDLKLKIQIHKESATLDTLNSLFVAYCNLGDVYMKTGELETAKRCFEDGLSIGLEELADDEEPAFMQMLANTYSKLAMIWKALGELDNAAEYYLESYFIYNQLVDDDPTLENRFQFGGICCNLGNIYGQKEDRLSAQLYLQVSVDYYYELSKECGSVEINDRLASACLNLSKVVDNNDRRCNLLDFAVRVWTELLTICPQRRDFEEKRRIAAADLAELAD